MKSQIVSANQGLTQINWPRFWSSVLFGGLLLFQPVAGWGQGDNFNDGDDTGWFRYDPIGMIPGMPSGVGSWSFPGDNTYRVQTAPSPLPQLPPNGVGPGRAGSLRTDVTYSDFYLSVDIVNWNTNLDQAIGLVARMSDLGPGMSDGYALTYQVADGDIDITRFENENPSGGELQLDGSDVVKMVAGNSYRFIFIGVGSNFTARVYQLPVGRFPIVDVTATDRNTPLFTSGYCGVINFDNSGGSGATDATYDNYLALESEPPRLEISYIAPFQELTLKWLTNNTGFVLQESLSVDPTDWNDIPGPYQIFGDSYVYTGEDMTNPKQKFYRLIKP